MPSGPYRKNLENATARGHLPPAGLAAGSVGPRLDQSRVQRTNCQTFFLNQPLSLRLQIQNSLWDNNIRSAKYGQ